MLKLTKDESFFWVATMGGMGRIKESEGEITVWGKRRADTLEKRRHSRRERHMKGKRLGRASGGAGRGSEPVLAV